MVITHNQLENENKFQSLFFFCSTIFILTTFLSFKLVKKNIQKKYFNSSYQLISFLFDQSRYIVNLNKFISSQTYKLHELYFKFIYQESSIFLKFERSLNFHFPSLNSCKRILGFFNYQFKYI